MQEAYRVFTFRSWEKPREGALVEEFELKSGIKIPAILVGESGRGRQLGVLPVTGAKPGDRIYAARLGVTRSGRPKLFAAPEPTTDQATILVGLYQIGFRGANSVTGDRKRWYCAECGEERPPFEQYRLNKCPACGAENGLWTRVWKLDFYEPPGERIVAGVIAQGAAGRMGAGTQEVRLLPKDRWLRVGYSGRLYDKPAAEYLKFTGDDLIVTTWEERELIEEELGEVAAS